MKLALTYDDIQIRPRKSHIPSRSHCTTISKLTSRFYLLKPIVASPMDTVCETEMAVAMAKEGACGVIHRFNSIEAQAQMVSGVYNELAHCVPEPLVPDTDFKIEVRYKNQQDNFPRIFWTNNQRSYEVPICAAIGANGDYLDRAIALVNAGCNVLLIDVAHGHHLIVRKALETLRKHFNGVTVDIIAGNIATSEASIYLREHRADGLRVGVGGGSVCTTRIMTGIGVPMVTSISDCVQEAGPIPVMADGGIRTPGDICKAIALGSSTVMLGSMLAGTDESPGQLIHDIRSNQNYKIYRGSASIDSKIDRGENRHVEGDATTVNHKGSVSNVIAQIYDGLRSSMSYVDAENIQDFWAKAEFMRITQSGIVEARAHANG